MLFRPFVCGCLENIRKNNEVTDNRCPFNSNGFASGAEEGLVATELIVGVKNTR